MPRWTEKNANTVKKLMRTFEPANRFIVPQFAFYCVATGNGKLAAKLSASLGIKLAGWQALEMASQRHVCKCCESVILPPASQVCKPCLDTPKGKALSKSIYRESMLKASMDKYGVTNPMLDPKVKARHAKAVSKVFADPDKVTRILKKRRKTSEKLYGTEYPVQADSVKAKLKESTQRSWDESKKDRLAKGLATNLKRYGVSHYMKDPEIVRKQKAALLANHGHSNAAWGDVAMAKKKATWLAKYGTEHPMQNKKMQKIKAVTMIERYGVKHALQDPAIRKRAFETAKKLLPVVIQGKTFLCQGYESFVLPKLVKRFGIKNVVSQFDSKFEPLVFGDVVYCPDFYIRSEDTYVEVKSTFTLQGSLGKSNFLTTNRRLQRLANLGEKKLKFIIYHPSDDSCKILPRDWHTKSEPLLT